MMQVFDRVLATRVLDTLLYLSLIAGAAVLVLAMLEAARGQIMQRVASWVENRVAPEGFVRAIESTLRGRPYRMEAAARPRGLPRLPRLARRPLGLRRALGADLHRGDLRLAPGRWAPWIALGGALVLIGSDARHRGVSTSKLAARGEHRRHASPRRADAISRNCRGHRQHGDAAL
jgi:ATP-binding cassette subfamily C protein/ATP-binding cassette subfamily C protein EexD